jgi:hypothetical protein
MQMIPSPAWVMTFDGRHDSSTGLRSGRSRRRIRAATQFAGGSRAMRQPNSRVTGSA